jgi:hypothetical protein
MNTPLIINGRTYLLWQQFIDRKAEFIGGVLEDQDMGQVASTTITDITLELNGSESAIFGVDGKDFTCAFDVRYGGITGGEEGWLTFHGYGGHTWRIKKP